MIKAVLDRVIVDPLNKDVKSEQWVVLETRIEKPTTWIVIAVWSEVKDIKEGDTIRFTLYAPDTIEFENHEYQVLKEQNVLAINPKQ
jgi:chaperonin GroES